MSELETEGPTTGESEAAGGVDLARDAARAAEGDAPVTDDETPVSGEDDAKVDNEAGDETPAAPDTTPDTDAPVLPVDGQ